MSKRILEIKKNQELQRLTEEQFDDMSSRFVFHETIHPQAPVVLEGLTDREKSILILSVIGRISNVKIGKLFKCSEYAVRYCKIRAYKKLRKKFIYRSLPPNERVYV